MVVNWMKLDVNNYKNNEVVRILRDYSNLTQKDFAKELKKNVRTLQRYEAGDINIDLELIRKICEICDLTITIESKKKKK